MEPGNRIRCCVQHNVNITSVSLRKNKFGALTLCPQAKQAKSQGITPKKGLSEKAEFQLSLTFLYMSETHGNKIPQHVFLLRKKRLKDLHSQKGLHLRKRQIREAPLTMRSSPTLSNLPTNRKQSPCKCRLDIYRGIFFIYRGIGLHL